jgi:hypothetical protein
MKSQDDLRRQLNEYLFLEFGCGVEEPPPQVSADSPFALAYLGQISVVTPPVFVFEFASDGEVFFAVVDPWLDFFPKAALELDDLADQYLGSTWIGAREPIDSSTSAIGDSRVPPAVERRQCLQILAEEHLGAGATVHEGLFLAKTGEFLALVQRDNEVLAVGTSFPPTPVGFPAASSWRRLAIAVGQHLRRLS